jgi:hypothetical protein
MLCTMIGGAMSVPPARLSRVLLVEVERAQIADREREVVDRVARHLGAPRTATRETLTDAGAQLRDALVGDAAMLVGHRNLRSAFPGDRRGRGPREADDGLLEEAPLDGERARASSSQPRTRRSAGASVKYAKIMPKSATARCGTSSASQPASRAAARTTATPSR